MMGDMPEINWKNKTKDPTTQHILKRQAILSAAAELFLINGFHTTSVDDIAKKLGVTKPVIYYYMSGKDEILLGCVEYTLERIMRTISEIEALKIPALKKLENFFRRYTEYTLDEFGRCTIALSNRPLLKSQAHRKIVRENARIVQERIEALIKEGIKEKSISRVNAQLTAVMMFSAFNAVPNWWLPTDAEPEVETAFKEMWKLMSKALKP